MRFSQTTKCFYPEWGNYAELPEDIVTVPDEDFEAVANKGAHDSVIVENGRIVIVPEGNDSKLRRAKAAKAQAIEEAFRAAEAAPVSVNGWQFKGGFTSGLAIDAQRRAVERHVALNPATPAEVTFFDVHGQSVTVPLSSETEVDADDVCLSIHYAVAVNTFKYEQLRNAVWAAESIGAVNAISWE